jgi:hypothetical protein
MELMKVHVGRKLIVSNFSGSTFDAFRSATSKFDPPDVGA